MGAEAEPEQWELVAFPPAIHSDAIELKGAKRALKGFFFRLLPEINAMLQPLVATDFTSLVSGHVL